MSYSRSRDEEMGGKTTARLIESEGGEKDRGEGKRRKKRYERRESKEERMIYNVRLM